MRIDLDETCGTLAPPHGPRPHTRPHTRTHTRTLGHVRRPWLQLIEAVMALADKAELVRHAERGWASVTFSGTRHTMVLAFMGTGAQETGERFIAALPEHEFAIPRQLVADATVVSVEHVMLPAPKLIVEIELLLLEDA